MYIITFFIKNIDKVCINYSATNIIKILVLFLSLILLQAFSKNGLATITTADPAMQNLIGTNGKISFGDAKKINAIYNCMGEFYLGIIIVDNIKCYIIFERE